MKMIDLAAELAKFMNKIADEVNPPPLTRISSSATHRAAYGQSPISLA
jgi:hypothetical protein